MDKLMIAALALIAMVSLIEAGPIVSDPIERRKSVSIDGLIPDSRGAALGEGEADLGAAGSVGTGGQAGPFNAAVGAGGGFGKGVRSSGSANGGAVSQALKEAMREILGRA